MSRDFSQSAGNQGNAFHGEKFTYICEQINMKQIPLDVDTDYQQKAYLKKCITK